MIELKPLIYIFCFLSVLLLCYMIFVLFVKNLRRARYQRLDALCNNLINQVVFEDIEQEFKVPYKIKLLLTTRSFQKIFTEKIISAIKSFSGESVLKLRNLYLQLQLDVFLYENIKSKQLHIKAKAIQEIGVLKLENMHQHVFKLTNNKNELIRAEAQISIIKLVGADGLSFLNTLTRPISEWYQIILLREISYLKDKNFNGIDLWLRSKNHTVVIFALKLVSSHHIFTLYEQVKACLNHEKSSVRHESILTLTQIYNEQTAELLVAYYPKVDAKNKIAILKSLTKIDAENEIPFLVDLLNTEENIEIKIATAKTIASISPDGIEYLNNHKDAKALPLSAIILQIKEELKK